MSSSVLNAGKREVMSREVRRLFDLGWKAKGLAALFGVTPGAVNAWARGESMGTNPRWEAWVRAGKPKPSKDFPEAWAFSLWLQAKWRAFENERGAPVGEASALWRHHNTAAFDAWLGAK